MHRSLKQRSPPFEIAIDACRIPDKVKSETLAPARGAKEVLRPGS